MAEPLVLPPDEMALVRTIHALLAGKPCTPEGVVAHAVARDMGIPPGAVMTTEQAAEFRKRFTAASEDPRPFTPDEVRSLLRECVTVVRPGEAVVIRKADLTPNQQREYQMMLSRAYQDGFLPFRAFVFAGDELGVVEAGPGDG